MGKIYLTLSILGLLVLACSATDLIPATPTVPAPASLPTETSAFTSTPTPSFTPTPSSIPAITESPTPTETMVPPSTGTAPTSASQIPGSPEGPVFDSVALSSTQINWGSSCPGNSVTFTAHAVPGFNITVVLLFTRLASQTGNITTRWGSPTIMHPDGQGDFTYDLAARGIRFYQDFSLAWVQYQLVGTNSQQQIVGRSDVYPNNLSIAHCP